MSGFTRIADAIIRMTPNGDMVEGFLYADGEMAILAGVYIEGNRVITVRRDDVTEMVVQALQGHAVFGAGEPLDDQLLALPKNVQTVLIQSLYWRVQAAEQHEPGPMAVGE